MSLPAPVCCVARWLSLAALPARCALRSQVAFPGGIAWRHCLPLPGSAILTTRLHQPRQASIPHLPLPYPFPCHTHTHHTTPHTLFVRALLELYTIQREIRTSPHLASPHLASPHLLPPQALLDVYTIQREIGRLDNFCIGMVGDLGELPGPPGCSSKVLIHSHSRMKTMGSRVLPGARGCHAHKRTNAQDLLSTSPATTHTLACSALLPSQPMAARCGPWPTCWPCTPTSRCTLSPLTSSA